MQAITLRRAGSANGLVPSEVPTPTAGAGEILVRIHAATATRGDVVMRRMPRIVARIFGETPRTIPGYEFAGVVDHVGPGVTRFTVGDRVFGTTSGLPSGSYAEYIAVPATGLVAGIPDGIDFTEAAAVPVGAMAALHFLRSGGVGPDSRVLVNGASGSVGTFAVQIAKHLGAHVTAVNGPSGVDLVTSLGADVVIDYTHQDFTRSGETFDVVFDVAGTTSARKVASVLADGGRFVTTRTRRTEVPEELAAVRELLASGAITAVVGRTFPLEDAAEAHRFVEAGHKQGNVVLVVGDRSPSPTPGPDSVA